MTGEIVELKFRSPHVEDGARAMLACSECRNKTYLLIDDRPGDFPLMQCAACGQHCGRMGWAHDDDPLLGPQPTGGAA